MTYSAAQLDAIVKLVVERLRQMPEAKVAAKPSAPRHDEHRQLAKFHDVPQDKVDTSTLALTEKVVTVASLENRLAGVSRVMVAKGSVVTPAARDELRDRKILLQYGGKPVRTSGGNLVIGSDQRSIDTGAVAGNTTAHCLPHDACWKNLLKCLTAQISGQRKLGILITDQAAAAVCLANRNKDLRAILATTPEAVLASKQQLGANLMVIDPATRGIHGVRQLVGAFAHDGYLDPPRGMEI